MDKSSEKPYVVRKGAGNEKIIHAPDSADGWYRITETKDGKKFSYEKV
jgi:hypothetical protein